MSRSVNALQHPLVVYPVMAWVREAARQVELGTEARSTGSGKDLPHQPPDRSDWPHSVQ